jgi:hypothetical protein
MNDTPTSEQNHTESPSQAPKIGGLPDWVDVKFMVLMGTILFAYAGFYFTTQATLSEHSKEIISSNKERVMIQQQFLDYAKEDKDEHRRIDQKVNDRYEQALNFQATLGRTLGAIEAKIENLNNNILPKSR